MDEELRRRLSESGYEENGFAADYERFRPRPPAAILELLPLIVGADRLGLVVDLGSGTGLSARVWAELADEVVAIEPNEAMRTFAERVTTAANVRYLGMPSHQTGLPDASADLVTAAQSLQWMTPERVFPEVARILRSGGVFCAYNYVVLQTPLWEPEAVFEEVLARKAELRTQLGLDREQPGPHLSRALLEVRPQRGKHEDPPRCWHDRSGGRPGSSPRDRLDDPGADPLVDRLPRMDRLAIERLVLADRKGPCRARAYCC
jgi:SAM-dependent methyltransferase